MRRKPSSSRPARVLQTIEERAQYRSFRRSTAVFNLIAFSIASGRDKLARMTQELDLLRIVSERLDAAGLPFMLTGSFALSYYGKPRMTRDLDFVVALIAHDVAALIKAFTPDFYIDEDAVFDAITAQRMFNLMHLESAIKVDLIVRKDSEYRHVEFARRSAVHIAGVSTWIVSREDLILSKLVWALDSGSELQMRDVRSLLDDNVDWKYLKQWVPSWASARYLTKQAHERHLARNGEHRHRALPADEST